MFIVKPKYLYNRQINDYSCAKEEKIKKAIEHLFISFSQEDAGFNKKINEVLLYCPMDEKIKRLGEIMLKDHVYQMKKGGVILADTAVKLQQKIHQIHSGTVKDEEGEGYILTTSDVSYGFTNEITL